MFKIKKKDDISGDKTGRETKPSLVEKPKRVFVTQAVVSDLEKGLTDVAAHFVKDDKGNINVELKKGGEELQLDNWCYYAESTPQWRQSTRIHQTTFGCKFRFRHDTGLYLWVDVLLNE